jgi:hypothetical protein
MQLDVCFQMPAYYCDTNKGKYICTQIAQATLLL